MKKKIYSIFMFMFISFGYSANALSAETYTINVGYKMPASLYVVPAEGMSGNCYNFRPNGSGQHWVGPKSIKCTPGTILRIRYPDNVAPSYGCVVQVILVNHHITKASQTGSYCSENPLQTKGTELNIPRLPIKK